MSTAYGEQEIEQEIQAKGLTAAPRLTPASLDAKITGELYHVFPGTTLTVCCLVLENGFTVTGQSASVSPENFDEELGRKIARADAREKIWPLEGYLLRERLYWEAGIEQVLLHRGVATPRCKNTSPIGGGGPDR